MQPRTLAEFVENVRRGALFGDALADFIDVFDQMPATDQLASLMDEPKSTKNIQLDTLIEVIAEYLAKQKRLGLVPPWVAKSGPLDRPWHTSSLFIDWDREFLTDAMREYLTFSSPAEFASRNIFTEERPLRRARSKLAV
jgi:hypothetical protein